ncbi:hypothetical protein [Streptomyces sp. SS]|uniref:hypothetical protein n=1 Tax=Streptomyces sp. SS TaxID=260742 RepID=UPI0002E4D376
MDHPPRRPPRPPDLRRLAPRPHPRRTRRLGARLERFRPELLADPATTIVAGYADDGRIIGGAVLSDSGAVTGLSNLFATGDTDPSVTWAGVLAAAPADRPLVGYESGDDLPPALAAGFTATGPLRVWLSA